MTVTRPVLGICAALIICCATPPTWAAGEQPATVTPAIAGYGRVFPRPTLPVRPDPALQYHLLVDVVTVNANPALLSFSLDRLARLVNLFAYAGVPRDHVHVAAVLDGPAGLLALTDAAYRQRFHVPNPNLEVLHRLHDYGVQLMVCSQAMAGAGVRDEQMSAYVTITLSALTDLAIFGQRGYSYIHL